MTVKIDAGVLGIKTPIEVKESNRNFQKILVIQKTMLKVEALPDDVSDVEALDASMQVNEEMIKFLVDILRLNEKQTDALWDLTTEETADLIGTVIMQIQHQEPKEVAQAQEKAAQEDANLTESEKK
ncbi:phage tail tube assembly chaperone [uncultured Secundilactobacillus sp.]|uniref:phage tail tube assembly chaperone n=1 Tax=uncultured Secundilactobacillus sp. TaxID=2813935 RepID=UPI002582D05D|nr:phage tail tube assembly chaperone [uncultured Secundilactobacillus sp.]